MEQKVVETTSVSISVTDKKSSSNSTGAVSVSNSPPWMKTHEAYKSKTTMDMSSNLMHNREEKDLNRPFSSISGLVDDIVGGNGIVSSGSTVGPTTKCYSGGADEVVLEAGNVDDINRGNDDVFESCGGGGGGFVDERLPSAKILQLPLDIFAPASSYNTTNITPYQSPGMGYPFTHAQWQELERQAMIYKYMISSVSVPHDLLLFPSSIASRNNNIAVEYSSFAASSVHSHVKYYPRINNGGSSSYPEPGRCKRTDGKKWRCSKDVAPQQKYCERHLHRGRPRSRKHVEAANNKSIDNNNNNVGGDRTFPHKKTRLQVHEPNNSTTTIPKSSDIFSSSQRRELVAAAPNESLNNNNNNNNLSFHARADLMISNDARSCYNQSTYRDLGLMMGSENAAAMNGAVEEPNVEFGYLGSSVYGSISNNSMFYNPKDYMEHHQPLDHVLSHSNFTTLEVETPIGFIDAWSNPNRSNNNVYGRQPSLSPKHDQNLSSSLTLLMATSHGNATDEEMGNNIQVGNFHSRFDYQKAEYDSRWLIMNPNSWEEEEEPSFALGGPLGEALQPAGSVPINLGRSDPTSPYDSMSSHVGTIKYTTASSPSGVLHRTLFSHSDNSSACNSPALATTQPPEVAFRWPN